MEAFLTRARPVVLTEKTLNVEKNISRLKKERFKCYGIDSLGHCSGQMNIEVTEEFFRVTILQIR